MLHANLLSCTYVGLTCSRASFITRMLIFIIQELPAAGPERLRLYVRRVCVAVGFLRVSFVGRFQSKHTDTHHEK